MCPLPAFNMCLKAVARAARAVGLPAPRINARQLVRAVVVSVALSMDIAVLALIIVAVLRLPQALQPAPPAL